MPKSFGLLAFLLAAAFAPGLAAQQIGSMASVSGSSGQVKGLVFNSSSAAAANSTAINAALAIGGDVSVICPAATSILYIATPLETFSNTHFSFNCQIQNTNNYSTAIYNEAYVAPWTLLYNNSGVVANGPLSIIRESDVAAWGTSHSFTKGKYTVAGSNIYWESAVSCTSASSGAGPTGTGTGITDGTCTWNYVTTYTQSAFNFPTGELNDPGLLAVVNYPNHGLPAGSFLWLTPEGDAGANSFWWSGNGTAHQAGGLADSAYFGIFPVVNVNDTNNVTVVLRRAPGSAFTGIPMYAKAADSNIKVTGSSGALFNLNNQTGNGTGRVGGGVFFSGVANLRVDGFGIENCACFSMTLAGVASGEVSNIRDYGGNVDFMKIYSPAFDLFYHDIYGASAVYGTSGDDFWTMNTEETQTFAAGTAAVGDMLNIRADQFYQYNGLTTGIWTTGTPNLLIDQIDFARIQTLNGSTIQPGVIKIASNGQTSPLGATIGHIRIHDMVSRNSFGNMALLYVNPGNTIIQQIDIDNVGLSPLTGQTVGMADVVFIQGGIIDNLNFSHLWGSSVMDLVRGTGGSVIHVTVEDSNLIMNNNQANRCLINSNISNIGTTGVEISNNYMPGTNSCLFYDNSSAAISIHDNYLPAQTSPLVVTATNDTVYLANNYAPLVSAGALSSSTSASAVKVTSGGGNTFGGTSWFAGAGGESAYGWDIQCDVTKLTRTTGEYCYNTNASPGSGTLAQAGPVMDQGTTSGSWFALSNSTSNY